MIRSVISVAVGLVLVAAFNAPVVAQSSSTEALYIGRDGNWFNASNWSTGRVPGPADDVVLDGTASVVIDPALGSAWVQVRDLTVRGYAQLETRAGTILESRDEIVEDHGRIVLRASASIGDAFIATNDAAGQGGWCVDCTVAVGNPTPKQKRIIVLQSSLRSEVGLGGTTAASFATDASGAPVLHAGPGHYATLNAETVSIDGHLWLNLHYGFMPAAGDRFRIVEATRRATGQFIGLGEGALTACTESGVGLYITYQGGDGNDVELIARPVVPATCLLVPAIQKIREHPRPAATQARIREHVLLARQLSAAMPR
jgi:hypothetical protein